MRTLQKERPLVYGESQPPDAATGSYNVCTHVLLIDIWRFMVNTHGWLTLALQMEVCHDDSDAKLRGGLG